MLMTCKEIGDKRAYVDFYRISVGDNFNTTTNNNNIIIIIMLCTGRPAYTNYSVNAKWSKTEYIFCKDRDCFNNNICCNKNIIIIIIIKCGSIF